MVHGLVSVQSPWSMLSVVANFAVTRLARVTVDDEDRSAHLL